MMSQIICCYNWGREEDIFMLCTSSETDNFINLGKRKCIDNSHFDVSFLRMLKNDLMTKATYCIHDLSSLVTM